MIAGTEPTKVALVTGSGAKRVGCAIAKLFAARGYALALHARSSIVEAEAAAKEYEFLGTPTLVLRGDVREEVTVAGWIDEVRAKFGRLDVLVNAAAIWKRKPLEQVTADDVREHFDVNTLGTFLCSKHAGLMMVAQPMAG